MNIVEHGNNSCEFGNEEMIRKYQEEIVRYDRWQMMSKG